MPPSPICNKQEAEPCLAHSSGSRGKEGGGGERWPGGAHPLGPSRPGDCVGVRLGGGFHVSIGWG